MAALDFAGMLRAGLHGLGLHPAQFWDLTPAELALMLGIEGGKEAMTRQRLEILAARFPDAGHEVEAGINEGRVPAPESDGTMNDGASSPDQKSSDQENAGWPDAGRGGDAVICRKQEALDEQGRLEPGR